MTKNGICIQSDLSVDLDTDKLPGSRFFSNGDDMEQAGLQRCWGGNGGDAWRAMVTTMHGKKYSSMGLDRYLNLGIHRKSKLTLSAIKFI